MDTKKIISRYGVALMTTGAAIVLTRWTIPVVKADAFDFFQGAVVLSAWYGGLGPGIVSSGLSIVALDYFVIPPINAFVFGMTDLLRLAIFGGVAILSSSLSARLKRTKLDLQRAHDELEVRIDRRTIELSEAIKSLVREMAQRQEAESAIMEISNREQRRLGQDLHDGLSQILAGVKLMAERVKRELKEISSAASEKVALIESRLGEALAHVDTVSRGLYPVELETNGLMAALEELSAKTSKIYSVTCRFKCWRPVILDAAIANHVYRIVQEAVMNAIKSGKANTIHIRVTYRDNRLVVSVADNGIGFGNAPMRKGMGMKLMEYRARVIYGTLKFQSRSKGVTLVCCTIPLNIAKEIIGRW